MIYNSALDTSTSPWIMPKTYFCPGFPTGYSRHLSNSRKHQRLSANLDSLNLALRCMGIVSASPKLCHASRMHTVALDAPIWMRRGGHSRFWTRVTPADRSLIDSQLDLEYGTSFTRVFRFPSGFQPNVRYRPASVAVASCFYEMPRQNLTANACTVCRKKRTKVSSGHQQSYRKPSPLSHTIA